ncbi:MAG: ABC transporter permease subunit [Caldilineaceae bacterium]
MIDSQPSQSVAAWSTADEAHHVREVWGVAVELALLVLRKITFGALVLLLIIYLSFFGLDMARGGAFFTAAAEAAVRTQAYVLNLAAGNLGVGMAATSANNPKPVSELLWQYMSRSLGLLGIALLLAALVGVTLGVRAALQRQSSRSLLLIVGSMIGVSLPSFFVALLLQLVAIRWTRTTGSMLLPVGGFGWDDHLILPVLVLAACHWRRSCKATFVAVGQALDQDFVRTAHSKGLHPDRVLLYHVLRSAAVPIFTTIGVSLRFALSSLPVVELFFGWNGAGFLLLKAIAVRDYNFTIALLLCFGALIIAINLLLELLYRLVDPRLRTVDAQASPQNRQSLLDLLGEIRLALLEWMANVRAWARRFLPHKRATDAADLTGFLKPVRSLTEDENSSFQYTSTWTLWRRAVVRNPAFLLGGLLMLGLAFVYLFGPQFAPHSPYTTQGIQFVDGKLIVPPFAPGKLYPWGTDVMGRDIMSLVLAGAQQTLSLAGLVVLARLLIGFVLGAIAGWHSGRWPDRLIQAATEVLAAFPILLLAMLLILALGIRGGFRPFLIGLSLVGWVEIMQFVRGEILRIRPQPFLESAVATGVRTPQIVWRHMTPHLLPALISLAALEMGAVLMLLGELGFIGIFIGGGGFAELSVGAARYQYSDVPEWAALLSNVRLYARVYPWAALYPAAAFFVAILAFNLFGEGLRRLIERLGVAFNRLGNRYTVALILAAIPLVAWVRANTGSVAFYRQQAMLFDGAAARQQVQSLSAEANMGRALGSPGVQRAAEQIAAEFDTLGLQRAGGDFTWFQPRDRDFEQLTALPTMRLGNAEALVYGRDFSEFTGPFRVLGQAQGTVQFLAAGHLTTARSYTSQLPRALRDLDLSQSIVLVPSPEDVVRFSRLDYRGMLVVTEDAALLQKRFTLPARDPVRTSFGGVARPGSAHLLDQRGHGQSAAGQ